MDSQIICNENCVYQHHGNCYKTTVTYTAYNNRRTKCEFYTENTVNKLPNKKTFWKDLVQNYYN